VISPLKTKPIRTVLVWQLVATLAMAVIAALWAGGHGAMSALLGGLVNVAAGVVYAFLLGVGLRARSPKSGPRWWRCCGRKRPDPLIVGGLCWR
jgi:F0F1-type ATP synthase assembly protein I